MGQDLPPTGGYDPIQYKVIPVSVKEIVESPLISVFAAQPTGARFPSFILPASYGGCLRLRTLQDRTRDQRTEVCEARHSSR